MGQTLINSRRSEFQILANILELARGGVNKIRILYQVNLNYTQLTRYLSLLLEKNLLEEIRGTNHDKVYQTTEKGLELLDKIRKVESLME